MKRLALLSLVGATLLVSAPALAQSDNTQPGPPTDQPAPPTTPDGDKQPPPPTQPKAQPNNGQPNGQSNQGPAARPGVRPRVGGMTFRDDDQRHEYLMSTNPYYRDAYGGRRSGIMMAIIGGALGLSSIAAGSFGVLISCTLGTLDDITIGGSSTSRDSCVKAWHHATIWGGVGLLAVSLAVGITTAVGNHRRLKFIRSRYPVIEAGIAPGGGSMRLTWRF